MTPAANERQAEMDAKLAEMRKDPEAYFAKARRRALREQRGLAVFRSTRRRERTA